MQKLLSSAAGVFAHRSRYTLSEQIEQLEHLKFLFAGIFIYIVVVVIRSWDNFSSPGLYAEDSIHYFNLFYGNNRSILDVFQHPNGYYNIYNNLVAFLTAKANIIYQPFFYQLACITLSIITVCAFSFSGLLSQKKLLFASPLLLGLSGLNHLYYYISLTFQMYVVVLLLLTLLLYRRITSTYGNVFLFFLLSFLIWSGPYSVLVVPFCLCFIVLFKGRTALFSVLIAVTLGYTFSVTKSTIMLENLFNINILLLWGKTLITDVYFMGFKDSVNPEKILLVLSSLSLLFYFLRRDNFFLKTSILFLVIIVASFAPLFLSKKYLLYRAIFPCHKLIAQYFWLGYLLFAADRLLIKAKRYKSQVGTALIGVVVAFVIWDNYTHPDKFKAPVMTNIKPFLYKVKELEESGLAERHEKVAVFTSGTGRFFAMAVVGDQSRKGKLLRKIHMD